MIGKMRNRITLNKWASSIDAGGGVSKGSATKTMTVWADVENRTGSIQTTNDQRQWAYDYKVTVRYTIDITQDMTITHDNKQLQINSMQKLDEGRNLFLVLRCSTID